MPTDIATLSVLVPVVIGLLSILGIVFGWFGNLITWAKGLRRAKPTTGLLDVPIRTMILIPASRANALWWHLGSVGDRPAMQIVGDLNVTNISTQTVYAMGAKLRKPKAVGHAMVRQFQGGYVWLKKSRLLGKGERIAIRLLRSTRCAT